MTTAQDIINGAAKLAGVLAEGQTLESGINTDALNRLNRLLDRLQNDGVDFGLSSLSASDTIYIDLADEEAIEALLAVRLMIRHRMPPNILLIQEADEALTELRAKYHVITEMGLDPMLTIKPPYNIRTD